MFEKQLHHLDSVLLAGDVKWSEPVLHTNTHTNLESKSKSSGRNPF